MVFLFASDAVSWEDLTSSGLDLSSILYSPRVVSSVVLVVAQARPIGLLRASWVDQGAVFCRVHE